MFLLLNAIVASFDGLIIGISLHLTNTKLTKTNIFLIFIGNICIYSFFLILYKYFSFTFMTKKISTLFYLFLAWRSLKEEENHEFKKTLSIKECILLTLTHSLDGTIVSLNFVYNYQLIHIIFIFSIASISILLFGYYSFKLFKNKKKNNYISAILFSILAIINLIN